MLSQVTATRYVQPLTTGGSVPGVVEADDLGTYVVKFTGSAQGRKALVAEIVVGELARRLGFRVPELVLVDFDPAVARDEPHQEVQDLVRASAGINLGMDLLPGAVDFHPGDLAVDPAEAGRVVWLDALTANVDRTVHSTNLMIWPCGRDAALTPAALADRPRGGARLPPPVGQRRRSGDQAVRLPPPRPRRVRPAGRRGRRGTGTPGHPRPAARGDRARPRRLAAGRAGLLLAGRAARGVRPSARGAGGRLGEWLPLEFPSARQLAEADAERAAATRAARPAWLQHVPDLHGKPDAAPDWSRHLG